MVYRDDLDPPLGHQSLPYDPWNDPGYGPPVAPDSDELRHAIGTVIGAHPKWGPARVKAYLERVQGYSDVPIEAVCGAKAGM